MTDVLIWTQRHAGIMPCEDEGSDGADVSPGQGMLGERPGLDSPSERSRGNQLADTLILKFSASRTVRQQISVVSGARLVAPCYGRPSEPDTRAKNMGSAVRQT